MHAGVSLNVVLGLTFLLGPSLLVHANGEFNWTVAATDGVDMEGCGTGAPFAPCRTLQFALDRAPAGATVLVAPGNYSGAGNYNLHFTTDNVWLRAPMGPAETVINPMGEHRVFSLDSVSTVRISGFTLTNASLAKFAQGNKGCGNDGYVGGTMMVQGIAVVKRISVFIDHCWFIDAIKQDVQTSCGSVVYLHINAFVTFSECYFAQNKGVGMGMIYVDEGSGMVVSNTLMEDNLGPLISYSLPVAPSSLRVVDSTFRRNSARKGAVMYLRAGQISVLRSSFVNNTASLLGSVIYMEISANASVHGCEFLYNRGNTAGVLYSSATGGLRVSHSVFRYNYAVNYPVMNVLGSDNNFLYKSIVEFNYAEDSSIVVAQSYGVNLKIERCHFANNSAARAYAVEFTSAARGRVLLTDFMDSSGETAAVVVGSGSLVVFDDCLFTRLRASGPGGVFSIASRGIVIPRRCTFRDNSAEQGAVAYLSGENAFLRMEECHVFNNVASSHGGVLMMLAGTAAVIHNTTVRGNSAGGNGGVASLSAGAGVNVSHSKFHDNTGAYGGVMFVATGVSRHPLLPNAWPCLATRSAVFTNNTATRCGGAIYWDVSVPPCVPLPGTAEYLRGISAFCSTELGCAIHDNLALAVYGENDGFGANSVTLQHQSPNTLVVAPAAPSSSDAELHSYSALAQSAAARSDDAPSSEKGETPGWMALLTGMWTRFSAFASPAQPAFPLQEFRARSSPSSSYSSFSSPSASAFEQPFAALPPLFGGAAGLPAVTVESVEADIAAVLRADITISPELAVDPFTGEETVRFTRGSSVAAARRQALPSAIHAAPEFSAAAMDIASRVSASPHAAVIHALHAPVDDPLLDEQRRPRRHELFEQLKAVHGLPLPREDLEVEWESPPFLPWVPADEDDELKASYDQLPRTGGEEEEMLQLARRSAPARPAPPSFTTEQAALHLRGALLRARTRAALLGGSERIAASASSPSVSPSAAPTLQATSSGQGRLVLRPGESFSLTFAIHDFLNQIRDFSVNVFSTALAGLATNAASRLNAMTEANVFARADELAQCEGQQLLISLQAWDGEALAYANVPSSIPLLPCTAPADPSDPSTATCGLRSAFDFYHTHYGSPTYESVIAHYVDQVVNGTLFGSSAQPVVIDLDNPSGARAQAADPNHLGGPYEVRFVSQDTMQVEDGLGTFGNLILHVAPGRYRLHVDAVLSTAYLSDPETMSSTSNVTDGHVVSVELEVTVGACPEGYELAYYIPFGFRPPNKDDVALAMAQAQAQHGNRFDYTGLFTAPPANVTAHTCVYSVTRYSASLLLKAVLVLLLGPPLALMVRFFMHLFRHMQPKRAVGTGTGGATAASASAAASSASSASSAAALGGAAGADTSKRADNHRQPAPQPQPSSKVTRLIRTMSPAYLVFYMTGCVLGYIYVFLMVPALSRASCVLQAIAGHLAFVLIVGALITKVLYTDRFFNRASPVPLQSLVWRDFRYMGLWAFLTVVYLTVWFAVDAPFAYSTIYDHHIYDTCETNQIAFYLVLYVIEVVAWFVACVLVYNSTASLFPMDRDHYLNFLILCGLGGLICAGLLYFDVVDSPEILWSLQAFSVYILITTAVVIEFYPKFRELMHEVSEAASLDPKPDFLDPANHANFDPNAQHTKMGLTKLDTTIIHGFVRSAQLETLLYYQRLCLLASLLKFVLQRRRDDMARRTGPITSSSGNDSSDSDRNNDLSTTSSLRRRVAGGAGVSTGTVGNGGYQTVRADEPSPSPTHANATAAMTVAVAGDTFRVPSLSAHAGQQQHLRQQLQQQQQQRQQYQQELQHQQELQQQQQQQRQQQQLQQLQQQHAARHSPPAPKATSTVLSRTGTAPLHPHVPQGAVDSKPQPDPVAHHIEGGAYTAHDAAVAAASMHALYDADADADEDTLTLTPPTIPFPSVGSSPLAPEDLSTPRFALHASSVEPSRRAGPSPETEMEPEFETAPLLSHHGSGMDGVVPSSSVSLSSLPPLETAHYAHLEHVDPLPDSSRGEAPLSSDTEALLSSPAPSP